MSRTSARSTSPPTVWCTPRCASLPSCTSSAGCRSRPSWRPSTAGFRRGERDAPCGRPTDRGARHHLRDADRAAIDGDRPARRPPPRARRQGRRFRPRRRRDGLAAVTARRGAGVRAPAPPQRHRPRLRATRPRADRRRARCTVRTASATASGCSATSPGGAGGPAALGPLARYVLDRQVHLEMAPTCHVQVGAVPSFDQHPIAKLLRAGFNVGINTDNRLMSDVMPSSELLALPPAPSISTGSRSNGW